MPRLRSAAAWQPERCNRVSQWMLTQQQPVFLSHKCAGEHGSGRPCNGSKAGQWQGQGMPEQSELYELLKCNAATQKLRWHV